MTYEVPVHSQEFCSRNVLIFRAPPEHFKMSSDAAPLWLSSSQVSITAFLWKLRTNELLRALPEKFWLQQFVMLTSQLPAPFQCQRLPARAGSAKRNAKQIQPLHFTGQCLVPKLLPSALSVKVPGFEDSTHALPPGLEHSCLKTASQIYQVASIRRGTLCTADIYI